MQVKKAYLSIENLHKAYSRTDSASLLVSVLKGINLEADEGHFIALFGPNGCGKSTLLHIVAGILKPDAGAVTIGGKSACDARIGFVLQNYRDSLFPWKTALDNIAFPLELRGVRRSERHKCANELISKFGLNIPVDQYPYQLSGGQQQLIAISRALIDNPDLILMDEPFSALDYQTRIFMQGLLQSIWEKSGATVLFVSHELDEALLLADRLILLSPLPATILTEIKVSLPRPREHRVVASPEFLLLKQQALEILHAVL